VVTEVRSWRPDGIDFSACTRRALALARRGTHENGLTLTPMKPEELKTTMSAGLLSFPITDFDASGDFRADTYAKRLEWLMPYGATVLFAAGGTGEFFSLTAQDYSAVVRTAVDACRDGVPIIAGAGGPTRQAIAFAQEAERLGAQGVLSLPHYLTEAGQEGLAAHVEAVCRSVKFGVIIYNRGACRLQADTLVKLGGALPQPDRFQGRHRRDRVDGDDPPKTRRSLRVSRRIAHGGGLRGGLQGAGSAGVFFGGVQLHPEDGDGILPRSGDWRPIDDGAVARCVFPAVSGNPQPEAGLRGEHHQSRGEDRRLRRGAGAAAAGRFERRGIGAPGRTHQRPRSAVQHASP